VTSFAKKVLTKKGSIASSFEPFKAFPKYIYLFLW